MPGYDNRNIVLHELVGLKVSVVNSSDPDQIGIRGVVVDETKNLLLIRQNGLVKKVVKKISTFKFIAEKNTFTVKGEEISFRPHERIEKAYKFYRKRRQILPA
jgi:ribonuclease P protein subunit POP4